MKKLIVGFAAVGVVMALRPLVKRRLAQKMREHCKQMANHCKEMMEGRGETTGDEEIAARHRDEAEPVVAG